jgi:hypothetical protein
MNGNMSVRGHHSLQMSVVVMVFGDFREFINCIVYSVIANTEHLHATDMLYIWFFGKSDAGLL